MAGLTPWAHAEDRASSTRPAQTASPAQNGPLKPGHSAGVRIAQLPRTGLALVGASAVIAVVAVVASTGNGGGSNNQPNVQNATTTTTP